MNETREFVRPKRWDVPFSAESPDSDGSGLDDAIVERLLTVAPFENMDAARFPAHVPLRGILKNDVRQCQFDPGDVVIRQGDYGTSAFLVLMGAVRVVFGGLDQSLLGRRIEKQRSWRKSLWRMLRHPKSPESRDARRYPQMAGADRDASTGAINSKVVAGNILEAFPSVFADTPNKRLQTGQSFGELGALGRMPRSASVIAEKKSLLLEIRWQGLRDLRKYDDAFREQVDSEYRKHGLVEALRASSLLHTLNSAHLDAVTRAAQFESFGAFDWYGSYQELRTKDLDPLGVEPVVAAEGDLPRGLIVIRSGFARVSCRHGNGEQTLTYLQRGQSFGLTELSHNARHRKKKNLQTTLRAIGYLDVVIIPTDAFELFVLPHISPDQQTMLATQSRPVGAPGLQVHPEKRAAQPVRDIGLTEFLVEHRFINGTSTMMIDLDRCTRCDDCVRACAAGHDNNPRFLRQGAIFDHVMVTNSCMHCVDPVCMIGCPTGAIHRRPEGGEVVINDLTCIGCGVCAASCPYDNIHVVPVRDRNRRGKLMVDPGRGQPILKATKCDLCVDHEGGPACVRACPHEALRRVDMRETEALATWR